jgi:ABC-type sugar transport system ATPase subunit
VSGAAFAGVVKRYGDAVALEGLDLVVEPGELLVMVGPSGSGKSTALRALAGLTDVDAGTITVGGRDVTRLPPHKRDVAMVFQDYALYPHLTVAENVAFGLRARKVPAAVAAGKAAEVAEQLGIGDLGERYPDQLSGGQQQRVALARCMVREPVLQLMDEPLSNLDAQLRLSTRADIVALQRRLGTTTVYVTHDQAEAMTMGDRVAVLADGRLQQVGTPEEVYDRPANRFVAGFLGSPPMNLVAGGGVLGGVPGQVVGVRPEDLLVVGGGVGGEGFDAVVELVESLGSETVLRVSAGETTLLVRRPPRQHERVGDRLALVVDPARRHVFDAGSGARLDVPA